MSGTEKRGVRRSPQESLAELKKLAQESGFELLETQWLGTGEKHRFRHIKSDRGYEGRPNQLFSKGFPKDIRTDQERFKELRQLAQDNGYELLETQWLGIWVNHHFRNIESGKGYGWRPGDLFTRGLPKDLDIEQLRQLAQDGGYEPLETEWLGSMVKHRFRQIGSGTIHEWAPTDLFRRGFFNVLLTDEKRSEKLFQKFKQLATEDENRSAELFQWLNKMAADNGYELLEASWLGSKNKHRFRHTQSGRLYEGRPGNLAWRGFPKEQKPEQDRSPKGQRTEQDRFAASFHKLRQLAQANGFELLETTWLGMAVKHRFQHIESGKEREWAPARLFHQGFPKDLRTELERSAESFLRLKQLAQDNGFEVMETQWLGTNNKHRFRHIESGTERELMPRMLFSRGFPKQGQSARWVSPATRNQRRSAELFQKLRQLAQDNGYELLETQWLGTNNKHRFRHIESGKEREWVPHFLFRWGFPLTEGQRNVTQEVIRQVFSHIFGGEFNTNRDRLKAKNNGKPLELDGYEHFPTVPDMLKKLLDDPSNQRQKMAINMSLAFEFQGHQSHRKSEKVIRKDKLKARLCKEEAIHLIQIDPETKSESHFWRNIRNSKFMYEHVCRAIVSNFGRGIDFPSGFEIDLSNWNQDKERLQNLQELAENNGFELLETKYLGTHSLHRFRHIESGKHYEGRPSNLYRTGFRKNLRTNQDKFEQLRQLATDNGYELLETQWLGTDNKHRFRHIESGKRYDGHPGQLFFKGFPPERLKKRNQLHQSLQQLATDNGYELLETQWLGWKEKHRFRHIESGTTYEGWPGNLFHKGFPKAFQRPSPTSPQPQPDIPTTGPTANWFQLNDPSGAKLKLARIDGVPLMFIVDLSPLDPKSDECVELLGFHRVPNNSFLVRRVQEGERITEDSLRKVFPMVCEASMSCTELLIERPAPEPATSDLSISPERQQQTSQPAEPGLGQLMDHETEAHADLDETDEQEPDEQSFPMESCC